MTLASSATAGAVGDVREAFPLPPGCEEGYVKTTTTGVRLHYVAAGSGPLVVLLHGFPEFWYSWRYQLPALSAGRRVVALDLRGYNLSEKPKRGYDLPTLCEDVRGAIEALGAPGERWADIVGHDWGGVIAWAFAMRAPDYVRRLAIVNAPHLGVFRREVWNVRQLLRSSYVAFFQLRGVAERVITRDDYALVRRGFRAFDREHAWLADEDIQRFVEALARPGALNAALEYYRQLMRRGPAVLGPARVISAPTLVLWGELDPALGVELLNGLDEWVTDLHIQRFATSGHWLNQQEPARVNEALAAFLA